MRKYLFFPLFLLLVSCGSQVIQIGNLNMISTRNIEDNSDYKLLRAYVGNDQNNRFRDVKAKSLNESVNNVVRMVPGGEFLKNVKAYRIGEYYAVEGDVWGLHENSKEMRGFSVGQKVQGKGKYKSVIRTYKGIIVELKTDKYAIVQTEDGLYVEMLYDKMIKIL